MNTTQEEMSIRLMTTLTFGFSDSQKYLNWLTNVMMQSVETQQVLSAEMIPHVITRGSSHEPSTKTWGLLQRFSSKGEIEKWLHSSYYSQLIQELLPDIDKHLVTYAQSIDSNYDIGGNVSVAIATHVVKGRERAYCEFEKKIQTAQSKCTGFQGTYVQPPINDSGVWITMMRFDSQASLDQWFKSEERKGLLAESAQVIKTTNFQQMTTSFPGWFSAENGRESPANWKIALLILLGLYPSVMLVIKYLLPLLHDYHPAFNNFFANILTVSFTTWITMPIFIKVYESWLFPSTNTSKWIGFLSIGSLLILFLLEVLFFWRFF